MKTLIWFGALILSCGTAAASSDLNSVFVRGPDMPGQLTEDNTAAVAVSASFDNGRAESVHFGQAFAPTQTLRGVVSLQDLTPGSSDAKTASAFSKEVLLDSSVVAPGTLVPVVVSLRLDGFVKAGWRGDPNYLNPALGSADTFMGYRVYDLDQQDCTEGCRPLLVAQFGFDARLIHSFNDRGDQQSDVLTRYGWSWMGLSSGSFESPYVNDYETVFRSQTVLGFDTGVLAMGFDSRIGHRLLIEASLDNFVQAYGPALAIGHFGSTFDAEMSSSVAGVLFVGETPGVLANPIPEPATALLWMSGLIGLGALGRRRAAAARRG